MGLKGPVSIREGRPHDLAAIRQFATNTFTWGDYVPETYPDWLTDPTGTVLVAVDADDTAVAVVHVQALSAQEGWLSGARVDPARQRMGIGSLLNEASVDWLRGRGVVVVRLTVEEDNRAARSQVEKLGYRSVARFGLAARSFERPQATGYEENGGRRLPGVERFDLAPAAEAEPAYMVWSTGELNRAGHGLYAVDGWAFRRLRLDDLASAARSRHLWTSPSGWAIVDHEKSELWVSLFLTTPEEAARAVRALVDLADERSASSLAVMVPRLTWLEQALAAEHIELTYPNVLYEKAL